MKKKYNSPITIVSSLSLNAIMQTVSDPTNISVPTDTDPTPADQADGKNRNPWNDDGLW